MKGLHDFLGLEPDDLHARGLCSFGGSSPAGNTNTVQKADPWTGQQQFLIGGPDGTPGIYPAAASLYTGAVPQYFPDSTYAGLTPGQISAQNALINYGSAGGGPELAAARGNLASTLSPGYTSGTEGAFDAGQSTLQNAMSPGYLNPQNSPAWGILANEGSPGYLNPWNSPSFSTVVGNTLASALPAATSSFIKGNRSDSGLATRAATMAATDAVGNLAQNQYQANQQIQQQAAQQAGSNYLGQEALQQNAAQQAASNYLTQQGNQVKAAAVAPGVDQMTAGDLGTALQTAGMTQTDLQNQIQAAMSRYNYGQMLPWNQLGIYENAIMGTGSPGSTTTTSQPYFQNPMANIASGVAGAGTLAALGSAGAQAAGYSGLMFGGDSLLGALFGGALTASDRRVKTDIRKIGESDSGFPLYTFRYKGEPAMSRHIGLMAQDVEKEKPEAVYHLPNGMKLVNYSAALAA